MLGQMRCLEWVNIRTEGQQRESRKLATSSSASGSTSSPSKLRATIAKPSVAPDAGPLFIANDYRITAR